MAGNSAAVKVKIDNVVKKFNGRGGEMIALNGVNLDIHENEFITVVGPSGCGKSTILNIIAGLLEPTSGSVYVDGKKVEGPGPERGVVFQQYALFPWLTVRNNVKFALDMRGIKGAEADAIVDKYLKIVDLEKFANHYPKELSGGMKQRVGIARALVLEPDLLLLDEPLSAVDAITREIMQKEVIDLIEAERRTALLVTHDLDEAIILSDRIIVLGGPPAHVVLDVRSPIERPRSLDKVRSNSDYLPLRNELWQALELGRTK